MHNHNNEPMFTLDGGMPEAYIAAWEPVLAPPSGRALYPTMGAGGRDPRSSGDGRMSKSWPAAGSA